MTNIKGLSIHLNKIKKELSELNEKFLLANVLDIGDVIVWYPQAIDHQFFPCFGYVKNIYSDIENKHDVISIKWFGENSPFSNYLDYEIKEFMNRKYIKIYKEVKLEDLNL